MLNKFTKIRQALTFDDVLLSPNLSEVLPTQVDTSTNLTKKIRLNIPIVSSPMDTVTEARLAIALALEGGIGIIHKNLSIERQRKEIDKVKRHVTGMIVDPITINPDQKVGDVYQLVDRYGFSGFPVTDGDRLVGILSNRDMRFETDMEKPVRDLMTHEKLITAPVGTTMEEAKKILHSNRIEKLLVVDDKGRLAGLITIKDIEKSLKFPDATKDGQGRLRVGGAVGIGSELT